MRCCRDLLDAAGRRKTWDARSLQHSDLRRSLRMVHLLGLGLASCAGVGVYVLSAHVTKNQAGPSSVLSVMIASVAALLAGLCHAELAGRLPRAGTGYTYCYVTLGELSAFVVGWTMVLEHIVQSALAAKAWGHYLDFMLNDTLTGQMEALPTWQVPEVFAAHPDVLACVFMLIISLASFLSVKTFSVLTSTLTALSVFVLMAFVCVGYFHVQPHNWTQPPGFFIHGFTGVLSGAALLMTVFVGVDHVAGASQETRDPSHHLPSTLPLTSTILFVFLFLATSALTLSCDWQELQERAPIARAFHNIGIHSANYVIGVGAMFGLLASALVGLFHAPRILFSMAGDGLMPACFGKISRASVPVIGGLLTGFLASALALIVDFRCLVEITAIGVVIQFLTSAVVVLYVRYSPDSVGLCREYSDLDLSAEERRRAESPKLVLMANGDLHMHYHDPHHHHHHLHHHPHHHHSPESSPSCIPASLSVCSAGRTSSTSEMETSALFPGVADDDVSSCRRVRRSSSSWSSLFHFSSSCAKAVPSAASWQTTRYLLLVYLLACTGLAVTSKVWPSHPAACWWAVTLVCVSVTLLLVTGAGILRQPQSDVRLYFKTPWVPVLPLLSVVLCCMLLAAVPPAAWLRFAVWNVLGVTIYCLYGAKRSKHCTEDEQEVVLFDISERSH